MTRRKKYDPRQKYDPYQDAILHLENLIERVRAEGKWKKNPYMHGNINGLILALSVVKDDFKPPEFLAVKHYLEDYL